MPRKNKILNEISSRFTRKYGPIEESSEKVKEPRSASNEEEQTTWDTEIKYVSAIDSKPVKPSYIKLMSLQEFLAESKKDNGPVQSGGAGNRKSQKQ